MNIVGVGAAFCMGCCPNIRNGTAIAAVPLLYGCRRLSLRPNQMGQSKFWVHYYISAIVLPSTCLLYIANNNVAMFVARLLLDTKGYKSTVI